jgi:GT2 family glycosyltransferase
MMRDVAALIVTYNSQDHIAECIAAVNRVVGETVVIDNASGDRTASEAARCGARVITNLSNRGFAAAVNQGVRSTYAPFLLLLNPDASVCSGVNALVEECALPHVGAAGGQLCDSSGVPQRGFNVRRFPSPLALACEALLINRVWPNNWVNRAYRYLGLDLTKRAIVDQPAAAFLVFRRDAWEHIHGFDEGFFPVWFEDADFCRRLQNSGYQIVFQPAGQAKHAGAHSVSSLSLGQRTEYWYRSLLRYSNRHFGFAGRLLTAASVIMGQLLRAVGGDSQYRSRHMARVYGRLVRFAFRSVFGRKVQLNELF